jgi:WD40 repeat protein
MSSPFAAAPGRSLSPLGVPMDSFDPCSGLQVWDGATLELLWTMGGALQTILVLARSTPAGGEGVRIVAGESQGRVWLWDPEGGGEARALVGHTDCVNFLLCLEPTSAPHERWVASAGKDAVVRLWEAGAGRKVRALSGHKGPIRALLAFKEPERGRDRLASGGQDWTIRVWDAESGQALHVMQAEGCLQGLVGFLTTEGPFCLLSATLEGPVCLWNPAEGRLVRRLDQAPGMFPLALFETVGGEEAGGGWRQRLAGAVGRFLVMYDLGEVVLPGDDVMRPAHKLG